MCTYMVIVNNVPIVDFMDVPLELVNNNLFRGCEHCGQNAIMFYLWLIC